MSSTLNRVFSKKNVETTTRFFSAVAKTWIGMSPLWLMGEAILPGQKVGSQFKKGSKELFEVAVELRGAVSDSAKDVIVIIDQQLRSSKEETDKAAEVIKAAGENVIVVVSTSLEKAQEQIKKNSPRIKKSVTAHSKDVVVVVDKAIKHPMVITGITKFAKSQGVPHPEAILQVASLALSKLAVYLDEAATAAAMEAANAEMESYGRASGSGGVLTDGIQEVDAEVLYRESSKEAEADAVRIGKAGEGAPPKVEVVKTAGHHRKSASEGVAGPSNYGAGGAATASRAAEGANAKTSGANKDKGGCVVM